MTRVTLNIWDMLETALTLIMDHMMAECFFLNEEEKTEIVNVLLNITLKFLSKN